MALTGPPHLAHARHNERGCGTWPGIGPGKAPLEHPRDLHQDEIARDPLAGSAKTGPGRVKGLHQFHRAGAEGSYVADEPRLHFHGQDGLWHRGARPVRRPCRARITCPNGRAAIPCRCCRRRGRLRWANGATGRVFADDPATPVHRLAHEDLIAATERTGQELTHVDISLTAFTLWARPASRQPCLPRGVLLMGRGAWRYCTGCRALKERLLSRRPPHPQARAVQTPQQVDNALDGAR